MMTKERCRLCLSSLPEVNDIFSLTNGLSNSDLIKMFFEIEVNADDELPKTICHKCVQDLDYFHTNRLKYQMNQKILEGELHIQNTKSLSNGLFRNSATTITHSPFNSGNSRSFKQKESQEYRTDKYLNIREEDLIQLCNVKVLMARFDTAPNMIQVTQKGIKHTRRKTPKLLSKKKRIIDYYYHKNTKALRTLIARRLNEISAHSRSLHEDIYDFRISVEDRKKLCSIERWNNMSANLLEIRMEHNIFMCTFCCRMFNTKGMLRIHEQKHGQFVIKEYEPKSGSPPSPLTII